MSQDPNFAREAILEAVENQLRDNNPPITQKTLVRLKSEGFSSEEAKRLISCALATEIAEVLHNKEPFNEARYQQMLNNLPAMPWDE
ncbi:MAG: hypothetical protein ACK5L8_06585 [Marinicella pacifica]